MNSQIRTLRLQEAASERLLNIETRRVVERIDSPSKLTRAKLRSARTRLRMVELEHSAARLRKALATLTGILEEESDLMTDSIPLLPNGMTTRAVEFDQLIKESTAAREVAQLEYVVAHADRIELAGKAVLGTANIGDLAVAYINELEKFNVLLEVNCDLQRAQLFMLDNIDQLETWALNEDPPRYNLRPTEDAKLNDVSAMTTLVDLEDLTTTRAVLMVMITPAKVTLRVGQSQQYSAISIYNDGTAQDVTQKAEWQCSSNSSAIVSSSGLVTALSIGQVTVDVTVANATQSANIAIIPEDPALLNP